ncbi:MAG: hypothetical protein GY861_20900 [bacterium]|nr:hypothetical protein [bacterium]
MLHAIESREGLVPNISISYKTLIITNVAQELYEEICLKITDTYIDKLVESTVQDSGGLQWSADVLMYPVEQDFVTHLWKGKNFEAKALKVPKNYLVGEVDIDVTAKLRTVFEAIVYRDGRASLVSKCKEFEYSIVISDYIAFQAITDIRLIDLISEVYFRLFGVVCDMEIPKELAISTQTAHITSRRRKIARAALIN